MMKKKSSGVISKNFGLKVLSEICKEGVEVKRNQPKDSKEDNDNNSCLAISNDIIKGDGITDVILDVGNEILDNQDRKDDEVKDNDSGRDLSNSILGGDEILDGDNGCEMDKGNERSLTDEYEICVVEIDKMNGNDSAYCKEDGEVIELHDSVVEVNRGVVFHDNSLVIIDEPMLTKEGDKVNRITPLRIDKMFVGLDVKKDEVFVEDCDIELSYFVGGMTHNTCGNNQRTTHGDMGRFEKKSVKKNGNEVVAMEFLVGEIIKEGCEDGRNSKWAKWRGTESSKDGYMTRSNSFSTQRVERGIGAVKLDTCKWPKRKMKGVTFDCRKWPTRKKMGDTQCNVKFRKGKFDLWKWPRRKKRRRLEHSSEVTNCGRVVLIAEESQVVLERRMLNNSDGCCFWWCLVLPIVVFGGLWIKKKGCWTGVLDALFVNNFSFPFPLIPIASLRGENHGQGAGREFKDVLVRTLLQTEPAILKVLVEAFCPIVDAGFVKQSLWPELGPELRSVVQDSDTSQSDWHTTCTIKKKLWLLFVGVLSEIKCFCTKGLVGCI